MFSMFLIADGKRKKKQNKIKKTVNKVFTERKNISICFEFIHASVLLVDTYFTSTI